VVYSITPSGTEKVLYSFAGPPSDGQLSYTGLISANGILLGVTSSGGEDNDGVIYGITTSGQEYVFYSFTGGSNGSGSYSQLINVGGTFYGTTQYGGSANDGTIFSFTL
jgi:uncharacterized repeat protein (TIGR03803 family)